MLMSMLKNQNIEFDSLKIIHFKMMLSDQNSVIKYSIVIFLNCYQNKAHVFKNITILKNNWILTLLKFRKNQSIDNSL